MARNLYIAVYLVPHKRMRPAQLEHVTAQAFYATPIGSRNDGWPYDVGDDPSFFSAKQLSGPVTWGVCRPDVRNAIVPGDWIAFFATEPGKRAGDREYRFVAALRVERKIAQTDVFSAEMAFSRYLNLLVRPTSAGWEHFEPALHENDWHEDWLWRLCRRKGVKKQAVLTTQAAHRPGRALPSVAANYVVFSKSTGLILDDPPLVATHRPGQVTERWHEQPQARAIREVVLGESMRGLRTRNKFQPHRHIRRTLVIDDASWMSQLRSAVFS